MKSLFAYKKTAVFLLVITILTSAVYGYLLTSPIAYGMPYRNETVYDGYSFEGVMYFEANGVLKNCNSTFEEVIESRYYYKGGYVFFLLATTDEEYAQEVAQINANFRGSVDTPFYAAKINAFKVVATGPDGYEMIYTCTPAFYQAAAAGAVILCLAGITVISFMLAKKQKAKEEQALL